MLCIFQFWKVGQIYSVKRPTSRWVSKLSFILPRGHEILLHLTFRPYNAYCIYVGSNSDPNVIASITQLVECYKTLHPETNIFMAKDTKSVKWGNYSLLEADLICMEQLLALRNQ